MNKADLAGIFENHKGAASFYFTTDGQAFYTENEALNHQAALSQSGAKGEVTLVTREQYERPVNKTGAGEPAVEKKKGVSRK